MSKQQVLSVRYSQVAIGLHWAIALLIVFNLALGFFMEGFAAPVRRTVVGLHISSGMTVLALSVARVVWRLMHRPPPLPPHLASWEHYAATAVHALLYAGMLAMPLTGWMFVSAHPPGPLAGVHVWGVVTVPPITPIAQLEAAVQKQFHDEWVHIHSLGAWIMIALLALHVGAAIKHQFVDKFDELSRMGVGGLR